MRLKGAGGRGFLTHVKKLRLRLLGGIPVLALLGLALTYKYQGSDDLRDHLYRPLYSEFSQIENAVQQNQMLVSFQTPTKESLESKGEMSRLPKALREKVQRAYADAASLIGNMETVEAVQRVTSANIERIRSKEEDEKWAETTVAKMNAELMAKPGESPIRGFTFTHPGTSPGIDVRGENPRYSTPGSITWGFEDWTKYPESINTVEEIWTDSQFLSFVDSREQWYFRITRDDLRRNHLTLKQFLAPIGEAISKSADFREIQRHRKEVASELEAVRRLIGERVDEPKRLSDLLPW